MMCRGGYPSLMSSCDMSREFLLCFQGSQFSRRMRCLISLISGRLNDHEIVMRHLWIRSGLRCFVILLSRERPVDGSRKKRVNVVA